MSHLFILYKYISWESIPPADIDSGRTAEVRSRSMSCNCMTRTSQQECRGILEWIISIKMTFTDCQF